MWIIIDGYNFLKQVLGPEHVGNHIVDEWVNRFSNYVAQRHNKVTLVFDAGPELCATSYKQADVSVMYAGQGNSADDLIKKLLGRYPGKDLLLVTSDREICHFADEHDIISIGSLDFYRIFQSVMQQQEMYEQKVSESLHKTSHASCNELDDLMERSTRNLVKNQAFDHDMMPLRVRNGKKASKMDKRLLKKIQKI